MLTLGINTATHQNSICLFNEGEILAEKTWQAAQNQAEILLPTIKKALEEQELQFAEIKRILVVYGPGSFTSLRVGVITANTLAYALNVPLYGVTTFEFYQKRLPTDLPNAALLLAAGKNRAYCFFNGESELHDLTELPNFLKGKNISTVYGDILPEQEVYLKEKMPDCKIFPGEELKTFAEAFANEDFTKWQSHKQIEPYYVQAPSITMSPKISEQYTCGSSLSQT